MKPYKITYYTRLRAKDLGVTVKPSTVKGKKIDVFKNGKKVASVGALGYGDFPTFLKEKGEEYAPNQGIKGFHGARCAYGIWTKD